MIGVLMAGTEEQSVSGGLGRDRYFMRFVMEGVATLSDAVGRVDLRRHRAETDTVLGHTTMSVNGIEEAQVARGRWTLVGSALDETLLGGSTRGATVSIHAGTGRDVLGGTLHDDLLDGGRGVDTLLASGPASGGDDTCVSVERVPDGAC